MILSVRGLTKSYGLGEAKIAVLRGVDLDVARGEMCAVMGPSGVGKSTLLNLVAGLDEPDTGTIEVLGTPLSGLDDEARTLVRRDKVGIVYQFFNLVSNLTAIENVLLPYYIAELPPDLDAARHALERVGMLKRAAHLPAQLSGGEMQLVSIARALVRKPALVLADEPTGNVNVATGRRIFGMFREVLKETGSSMLMVTHNPEDAARADRVVFMQDGVVPQAASIQGDGVDVAQIHQRLRELEI
jgi:putative ABC transport system ATP-binding protein